MGPLATYALRLGDDSLILGQRLSEWCGHAPALEVDLSLANVALDQIGQATHFLNLAGALEGEGRDGDALAFRRDVMDFTNCLLVEQPNGDFAQTIARLFLFAPDNGLPEAPRVARVMGRLLGWNDARIQHEISLYGAHVQHVKAFAHPAPPPDQAAHA